MRQELLRAGGAGVVGTDENGERFVIKTTTDYTRTFIDCIRCVLSPTLATAASPAACLRLEMPPPITSPSRPQAGDRRSQTH